MSIRVGLVSFLVNFEHISHRFLVLLLLSLTGKYRLGIRQFHYKQENAMHCNNRDDLLQLSFTYKISIF